MSIWKRGEELSPRASQQPWHPVAPPAPKPTHFFAGSLALVNPQALQDRDRWVQAIAHHAEQDSTPPPCTAPRLFLESCSSHFFHALGLPYLGPEPPTSLLRCPRGLSFIGILTQLQHRLSKFQVQLQPAHGSPGWGSFLPPTLHPSPSSTPHSSST